MTTNDEILAILRDIAAVLPTLATKEEVARCATRKDLDRFATKDDLARCATKEDLARCATKEDLERFATKEDLDRFATKEDLDGMEHRVAGELAAIRTEVAVLSGRLDEQRHVIAALIPRRVAAVPRGGSAS